jgi:hypothetical protein
MDLQVTLCQPSEKQEKLKQVRLPRAVRANENVHVPKFDRSIAYRLETGYGQRF